MSTDELDDIHSILETTEELTPSATPSREHTNTPTEERAGNEELLSENPWDEEVEVPDEEIPDEEVPDEGAEQSAAKYTVENPLNEGNAYVAAGDQAQLHHYTTYHNVTNRYDHLQIILGSKQSGMEEQEDIFQDIRDLLKQTLALARQSSVVPLQETRSGDAPLPITHDEFSHWFYGLDEYEQCYAQAAALLHGASADEVSKRADELYLLHRVQQDNTPSSIAHSSEALPEELRSSLLSHHNKSSRDLQLKTFTTTQRVDGVERLYWRDVQADGTSSFHFQFLDFLAGEYLSKGLHGQVLLKRVQAWTQENNAEQFRCITRAFGVFLWHQSRKALQRQAAEWAKRLSVTRWQRTAILLDAAYEIDMIKYPEHEHDENASPTLQLLSEWVRRTQAMATKTDAYLGCAAANAYALIGKRKLEIALSGLEQLLQISSENLFEVEKLQAAVASAYFTLSWSGDIRHVLCHLSSAAEQSLLQSTPPKTARLHRRYRLQCQLRLRVSLDAFLFIALDSLSSPVLRQAAAYQESLPDLLSFAERQKRDIVLAGVLTTDETHWFYWREEVIKLLSAALIEKSSQDSAFDLLARWADALLHMEDVSSPRGNLLITSFQSLLVDLCRMLDRWCLELKRQSRQSPALLLYKRRLAIWSKKKDAFGKLFKK